MRVARRAKKPVTEKDLSRFRLLGPFVTHLERAADRATLHPSWQDPQRRLELTHYLSLFLFGLINPVLDSMRGLCAASHWQKVQAEVCAHPVSLGSFSEAQALLDPVLLAGVFQDLAAAYRPEALQGDARLAEHQRVLTAVDSTLWEVLPRMAWAVWRTQGRVQRAVRLHVKFRLLEGQVSGAEVGHANIGERAAWQRSWVPGEIHVGDRNFGEDYDLLRLLRRREGHFVIRLRHNAQWVVEEVLPLHELDHAARVTWQGWVRLGKAGDGPRVRVVRVAAEKEELLLVTDFGSEALSAELVGVIYRRRWQVELFFRWLKCILGCRHWLAESEQGVALQVYLALIAAQLLLVYRGRRPTKREMELLQMYLLGWASVEEVCAGLGLAVTNKKNPA